MEEGPNLERRSNKMLSILAELGIGIFVIILFYLYTRRNPDKVMERIEKNAIKIPNVDGETIYLKKSGFITKDWHRVYPPIDEPEEIDNIPEIKEKGYVYYKKDKTSFKARVNKMNLYLGGKKNFIKTTLGFAAILLIIVGLYYSVFVSYNNLIHNQIVVQCLKNAGIYLQ